MTYAKAWRCFSVRDDVELPDKFLKHGKTIMTDLKPNKNAPSSESENAQQVGAKRALYI